MKRIFKICLLLFVACILMTGCFNTKKEETKEPEKTITAEKISYADLNEIVSNYDKHINTDVVDVRDVEEYEEGHISGSINIPYDELYDIIIDTNREIIIYGDNASKSKQAAKDLIHLGYKNVKYIAGLNNWPYDLED